MKLFYILLLVFYTFQDSYCKDLGQVSAFMFESGSKEFLRIKLYLSTNDYQDKNSDLYIHYTDVNHFREVSFTLDKDNIEKFKSLLNDKMKEDGDKRILTTQYSGYWQGEDWYYDRTKRIIYIEKKKLLSGVFKFQLPKWKTVDVKFNPSALYFKISDIKKIKKLIERSSDHKPALRN